jgi:hypothetical protein
MVFGVGLGLENVERQSRLSVAPVPKLTTDGWTVEAEQLKNRRVAEMKWSRALAVVGQPNFLRTASRSCSHLANPVMGEPHLYSS